MRTHEPLMKHSWTTHETPVDQAYLSTASLAWMDLRLCLFHPVSVCFRQCLSVSLSLCSSVSLCLPLSLFRPSVCQFVRLSVCPSVRPSVRLSVCLSVSVCLSPLMKFWIQMPKFLKMTHSWTIFMSRSVVFFPLMSPLMNFISATHEKTPYRRSEFLGCDNSPSPVLSYHISLHAKFFLSSFIWSYLILHYLIWDLSYLIASSHILSKFILYHLETSSRIFPLLLVSPLILSTLYDLFISLSHQILS